MERYTRKFKEVETMIVSHGLDSKLRALSKLYVGEYIDKFGGTQDDAIARMCLSVLQANIKLDNKNAAKSIINLMKQV